MNPEEKAYEIFSAMLNAGRGLTSSFLAKECARIAVDEIISHIQNREWKNGDTDLVNYYKQVKQKITNFK